MKILVVTGTFPPRKFGGITAVSFNLSKKLVELGHDVTVYTTDLGNYQNSRLNVDKIEKKSGMKIHYFRNLSNYLAFKHRLFLPIHMILTLRKDLNKFDIIHLHDFRSLLSILIYHYAKKYGVPYVLQAHGSVPYLSQKELFKSFFDKLWGYNILNNASKVIALTETESEEYKIRGVPENKIEIVPNGINLSEYQDLPELGEFRKEYGIKNDNKLILYLGRLYKSKGIDLLIKSFSKLLDDSDINVKAGPDDGALSSLKQLSDNLSLNNKIIFTGPIYKKEKLAAYVDADVFVTPSFSGFPMTFLESCACGTPIVTTNNGDELNWVNNKIGFVVDYDLNLLKCAILDVITNKNLRFKFENNGKKFITKEFNWDKISKKVENIYKNCVESMQ